MAWRTVRSLRRAFSTAALALALAAHGAEGFAPEDGRTLLIVGQERTEIARFAPKGR